ncbi:MAG: RNA polymerase sigma factor [Bacteroidales bacterium]|nr:MAG: RNA polymerase sigma factor [Bacteroidales bacterium]
MTKESMQKKEERFNLIVKENHQKILKICKYYAPANEDQKDIYQEILVNIWKSLENFRGEAQESTWIYRIALNTAMGFAGKEFRRMRIVIDGGEKNLYNLFSEDDSDYKLKENQINQLQDQLNQLSVIDKAIMSLVLEDLSMKEISEIIGITEPNVRVKVHRIKEILREKMNGGNYEN